MKQTLDKCPAVQAPFVLCAREVVDSGNKVLEQKQKTELQ